MKCLAAVARSPKQPFVIEQIDLPNPNDLEILVRIVAVGICHTDLASKDGILPAPFPSVFGHEGAGVVERVSRRVTKVVPGDHVVLAPASDGTCPQCKSGAPMYCDHFSELNFQTDANGSRATRLDGTKVYLKYFGQSSFAQYALASEQNTVRVRKDVPLNILGPLGCGIQTGAGTVINGLMPHPGASIAILGSGAVGLAAILGAAVCGCATIIAIDIVDSRLDAAAELGATHTINTKRETDLSAAIRMIAPSGVNYIVDCAGIGPLIVEAIKALAIGGTLGLVAVPPSADRKLDLPWLEILLQGQVVQGFTEGNSIPDIFIPQMIDLYSQGRFPFDKLIKFYPLEKINEAVADQLAGRAIKAVLNIDP